ncbi:unnamed protein product [Neospora caninum Liverpool]|uniref:AP2 domain transcription factor AP2IX-7 n=1 Tax=Neospora caninum (strain Liverpool) TaxID=572307 RepID=F0VC61_NEOCL|nr:uncharacterized protein NCLIV_042620 [Neospora caninum Liverpool]CBZ51195.1 unnamed protein product [Neospora caninum Liverpool]CEL68508.1 TPA: AP2 domain transcription factor AP2IX-7 [Neospora caninum Liverpool]|eukprot:XP_003881228.1 uncharacterized protein NCLIV_042620 [Neospora caninum Liverpool]
MSGDGATTSTESLGLPFAPPTSTLLRPPGVGQGNYTGLPVHAVDSGMLDRHAPTGGVDGQLYVLPHQALPLQTQLRAPSTLVQVQPGGETELARKGDEGRQPGKFDSPKPGSHAHSFGNALLVNPQLVTPFLQERLCPLSQRPALSPPGPPGLATGPPLRDATSDALATASPSRAADDSKGPDTKGELRHGGCGDSQTAAENSGATPGVRPPDARLLTATPRVPAANSDQGRENVSNQRRPDDGVAGTPGVRETPSSAACARLLPGTAERRGGPLPLKPSAPEHERLGEGLCAQTLAGGDSPFSNPERGFLPPAGTSELVAESVPHSRALPLGEFRPGVDTPGSLPMPHRDAAVANPGRQALQTGEKAGETLATPAVSRLPSQDRVNAPCPRDRSETEETPSFASRCLASATSQLTSAGPSLEENRSGLVASTSSAAGSPSGIFSQSQGSASPATDVPFPAHPPSAAGPSPAGAPADPAAFARSRGPAGLLPGGAPGATSQAGRGDREDQDRGREGRPEQEGLWERHAAEATRGLLAGVPHAAGTSDEAGQTAHGIDPGRRPYLQDRYAHPAGPNVASGAEDLNSGPSSEASAQASATPTLRPPFPDAGLPRPFLGTDFASASVSASSAGSATPRPPAPLTSHYPNPCGPSAPGGALSPHAQQQFRFPPGHPPLPTNFRGPQPGAGSSRPPFPQYPPSIRGPTSGTGTPQSPAQPSVLSPAPASTAVSASPLSASTAASTAASCGTASSASPLPVGFQNPFPLRPAAPRDRGDGAPGRDGEGLGLVSPGVASGPATPRAPRPLLPVSGKGSATHPRNPQGPFPAASPCLSAPVRGSQTPGPLQPNRFLSSVSGVVYDKGGEKWIARWSENGKPFKKTFAVGKHGFEGARKMAEESRLQALYAKQRSSGASRLPASLSAKTAFLCRSAAVVDRDKGEVADAKSLYEKPGGDGAFHDQGWTDAGAKPSSVEGDSASGLGNRDRSRAPPGLAESSPGDGEGLPAPGPTFPGSAHVHGGLGGSVSRFSPQYQASFRLYDGGLPSAPLPREAVPQPADPHLATAALGAALASPAPLAAEGAMAFTPGLAAPPRAPAGGSAGPHSPRELSGGPAGLPLPGASPEGCGTECAPIPPAESAGKGKVEGVVGSGSSSARRRRKREERDEKLGLGDTKAAPKKALRTGALLAALGSEGLPGHAERPGDPPEEEGRLPIGLPSFYATAPLPSSRSPSTASLASLNDKAAGASPAVQRADLGGAPFSPPAPPFPAAEGGKPEGEGRAPSVPPAQVKGDPDQDGRARSGEQAGRLGVSLPAASASQKRPQKQLTRQIQRQQQLFRQQEALLHTQAELFSRLVRRRARQQRNDLRRRTAKDIASLRRRPDPRLSALRDCLVASARAPSLKREKREGFRGSAGEAGQSRDAPAGGPRERALKTEGTERGEGRDERPAVSEETEGDSVREPGAKHEGHGVSGGYPPPWWLIPPDEELKAAETLRALRVQRRAAAREGKLLQAVLEDRRREQAASEESEGTETEADAEACDAAETHEPPARRSAEDTEKAEHVREGEKEGSSEAEMEASRRTADEEEARPHGPAEKCPSAGRERDASPPKLPKTVRFAEILSTPSSGEVETGRPAEEEPSTEILEGATGAESVPVPLFPTPPSSSPLFPCTAAQLADLCMHTLYALGAVRPHWRRQDRRRPFGWHISQIKPDLILPPLQASRIIRCASSPAPSASLAPPCGWDAGSPADDAPPLLVYGDETSSMLRSYVDAFRPLFSSPSSPPPEFLHLSSGDVQVAIWQLDAGGRAAVIDGVLLALDALYELQTGRRLRLPLSSAAVSTPHAPSFALHAPAKQDSSPGNLQKNPVAPGSLASLRVDPAPNSPAAVPGQSHVSAWRQAPAEFAFEAASTQLQDRENEKRSEATLQSPSTAATLAPPQSVACVAAREENLVLAYNPEAKVLRQVNYLAVGVRVFIQLAVVEQALDPPKKRQAVPGEEKSALSSGSDDAALAGSGKEQINLCALFVTVPGPSVSTAASKPHYVIAELVDRRFQLPCGEQFLFRPLPLAAAAPAALLAFTPARVRELLRLGAMCLTRFTEKESGKRPRGGQRMCTASSFFYSPPPIDMSQLASFSTASTSTQTPPAPDSAPGSSGSSAVSPESPASSASPPPSTGKVRGHGTSPCRDVSFPEPRVSSPSPRLAPGASEAAVSPSGTSGPAAPASGPGRPAKPVCCPAAPAFATVCRCKCSHRRHELQAEIKQKLKQDKKRCLALIREYPDLSLLVGARQPASREKETLPKRQTPQERRAATPSGAQTPSIPGIPTAKSDGQSPSFLASASASGFLAFARTSQLEILAYLVGVDPWKFAKNRQDAPKPEEIPQLLARYKAAVRTPEYGRLLQKWKTGHSEQTSNTRSGDAKDNDGFLSPAVSPPGRRKHGKDPSVSPAAAASAPAPGHAPSGAPSAASGLQAAPTALGGEGDKEGQVPQVSPRSLELDAGARGPSSSMQAPALTPPGAHAASSRQSGCPPPWLLPLVPPGGTRLTLSPQVHEELLRIQTAMTQLTLGTAICVRVKALLGLPAGTEQHIRGVVTRNALKFPWELAEPSLGPAGAPAGGAEPGVLGTNSQRAGAKLGAVSSDEASGEKREKLGFKRGVDADSALASERKESEGVRAGLSATQPDSGEEGAGYVTLSLNNRKEEFILSFREVQCLVAQDDLRLVRTRARQWVSSFGASQPGADRKGGDKEEEKEAGGRTRKYVADDDFF